MRELCRFFQSSGVSSLCAPHIVKQTDPSWIPKRLDSIG